MGGPATQKFLNAAELKNYPMPYRVFPTGIALICFLILALGFASTHGGAAESLVQVGYGGIAGYQLPLWVNKDHGISKKYGIELEPLLISGGALNMQALLAGSIQMSQNSASSALQAVRPTRPSSAGAAWAYLEAWTPPRARCSPSRWRIPA